MFILEGAPSVILGFVVYRCLTDPPREKKWLTPAEKYWAETRLRQDAETQAITNEISVWQGLKQPKGLKLAMAVFFNVGTTTIIFWLPTLIKKAFEAAGAVSMRWSTLPFAVGMVALRILGWSSDRKGGRKWHCILTQITAAPFLNSKRRTGYQLRLVDDLPVHDGNRRLYLAGALLGFAHFDAHPNRAGCQASMKLPRPNASTDPNPPASID
jgi:hypothetical protein